MTEPASGTTPEELYLELMKQCLTRMGFVIVDDYGLPTCRAAIEDFRRSQGIPDPIHLIDWTGAFWQRSTASHIATTARRESPSLRAVS